MTLNEREWAILTGQVGRSDDLQKAIKDAIDNPKTSETVDVVEYVNGQRMVVGQGELVHEGDNINIVFSLQHGALSKKIGALGPFSIGVKPEPKPFPSTDVFSKAVMDTEQREQMQALGDELVDNFLRQGACADPACAYMEPHKHGFACTAGCRCNRNGRVD